MSKRIIKFRAWDKQDKELIEEFLPDWGNVDQERYFLMQYTGLRDKDGQEIYDRDWLKADTKAIFPMIVKWHGAMAGWSVHGNTNPLGKQFHNRLNKRLANSLKVIGHEFDGIKFQFVADKNKKTSTKPKRAK